MLTEREAVLDREVVLVELDDHGNHRDDTALDMGLQVGEELPVRLVRVVRLAEDHDRECQRLGGLELGADRIVGHGTGVVGGASNSDLWSERHA